MPCPGKMGVLLPFRSPAMLRKLFVTTALPYANAAFHIGHIMEYIQADIWVRTQRMQGHEVHWIQSRPGWTPYDGVTVKGWPVGTFVRGRRVMWQGDLTTPAKGEPVRFFEGV